MGRVCQFVLASLSTSLLLLSINLKLRELEGLKTEKNDWIDTHCHLNMIDGELSDLISRGFEQGVSQFITIGTDDTSNRWVAECCKTNQSVFGGLGIHPHYASGASKDHFDWIKSEILKNPKILAVGECGFDFYYNRSSLEDQKQVFNEQLELAQELQLPVIIHSREAEEETKDLLMSFPKGSLQGVFHSFTSSLDLAKFALDLGFYLSFNGICTFPKSDLVREVLCYVPLDRILLETDAPFLAPIPYRGKTNVPANIPVIGDFVADLLSSSVEKVSLATSSNARKLFHRILDAN